MRIIASARRRGFAAAAAGLLIIGAASASAMATPPKPNTAAEAEEEDAGDEEAAPTGNTAQPTAPTPQAGQAAAAGLSHDEAVAATREGLRKSAIGSGIRRLRLFDYILMAGVGVLLLLSIALLIMVMGLRSRLAALTGGATTVGARNVVREDEPLYGNPAL